MADPALGRITFRESGSREAASADLAERIAASLRRALAQRKVAHLVVSGGTSPVSFFHHLREVELPWERVVVSPSDERDVPAGHPDRNDAMIQRELLAGPAAAGRLAGFLPRGDGPPVPGELLEALPARFDAVVLGMGEDGHTASLFPDSPTIDSDLACTDLTVHVTVPRLGARRISLTPAALLNTGQIDLLFFGSGKREVFEKAQRPGPASTYPVRVVLHQDRVPVRVSWAP